MGSCGLTEGGKSQKATQKCWHKLKLTDQEGVGQVGQEGPRYKRKRWEQDETAVELQVVHKAEAGSEAGEQRDKVGRCQIQWDSTLDRDLDSFS